MIETARLEIPRPIFEREMRMPDNILQNAPIYYIYWNDLPGTELLKRVFTQPVPIEKISLFSINIGRDGPSIIIDFDLINQIPDAPPQKWTTSKFNRCRLGINCGGVKELSITGWDVENIVDVNIQCISAQKHRVCLKNDEFHLEFMCSALTISGPSVYLSH